VPASKDMGNSIVELDSSNERLSKGRSSLHVLRGLLEKRCNPSWLLVGSS
jgi:hypothetical protein